MRTLIAYSTIDGQTLKISQRLKELFEQRGHAVELMQIGQPNGIDPAAFDCVVIGASVRYGKYRADVYQFIMANRATLDKKRAAFFSVNLVARKAGRDTADSNPYIRVLKRNTNWAPKLIGVFAGKLDYQRYGPLDRQVIRLIMWLTQGPTRSTACVEFTDWLAVAQFAQRVSDLVDPSHKPID